MGAGKGTAALEKKNAHFFCGEWGESPGGWESTGRSRTDALTFTFFFTSLILKMPK